MAPAEPSACLIRSIAFTIACSGLGLLIYVSTPIVLKLL